MAPVRRMNAGMELYQQWLETRAIHRSGRALHDCVSGRVWTFDDLARALDAMPRLLPRTVAVAAASEGTVAFVLRTLQAWRDDAVLWPVECDGDLPHCEAALPETVAHVKTTSGSTGEPQSVLFTAAQLRADFEQLRHTMGLRVDTPNVAVISPAHSYGFSNLVLPLLLGGMPLVLPGNPLPGTLRTVLAKAGPVILPAVPAMWRAWHQTGVLQGADIRCAISAGAPLTLDLERSVFEQWGLKLRNFYGASECGGIAFDDSDEPRDTASLVGRAITGVSLDVGEDGCLSVRSPAVAMSYGCAEPELAARLADGVFQTSDLARLESGLVHIDGRLGDIINVAGRKVSPQQIETILQRHSGVRHCLVFGVPSADPSRVEDIVACVHGDCGVSCAELQSAVGAALPGWQLPRHWWLTEDLLPDARGKLSRAQWRSAFLAR